ncbi:thiamine-phosphate kinase [Candidatus Aquiluna sp. UB-MaderosW2red]|uniref:thiamine-phosphate kinase n=1 Tax=Candidatus Aquiluna sp. UB-MaderosW2red TaxID=1855377 RepID=UPI000875E09E|nr:thiamine-phosphate kinase [Candidatus Aquiluna sp. UB-MaderosW2red]SCX14170.1 thiamine-monophosphate kinase [Candidatus Aquiluna sp. UB-MaderosW2red]
MNNYDPTVFELGEIEALKRAVKFFRPVATTLVGSGDDAAVISVSDNRFVVTSDTMVENHDFRTEFSSGFDLGYKAIATNLADVVAMGAIPNAVVVAMVIPKTTKQTWLEDFARGMQEAIDYLAPSCAVVGGDLAAGDNIVIAVTAHGDLEGRKPVLRSGTRPGDLVAVAGTLGWAACGLELLMHQDPTLKAAYPEFVDIQLRPNPLIGLGLEVAKFATAMLDISDGLSLDAARLANASGVSIRLDPRALSGFEAVLELAAQSISARQVQMISERDWVLHGGEDHSFLFTCAKDSFLPRGCKVIGEVVEVDKAPLYFGAEVLEAKGWDSISG